MKALVLTKPGRLEYGDLPTPAPSPDEVLVAVRACGICGSDVHGLDGSTGRRQPPLVMGHEASGVIAAVGSAVTGWAEGERVTFDSTISCGRCDPCRRGEVNLCEHRRVLGVSCDEYRQDGAFADYVAVPAHILYRLPDELSFERAAFAEPLSVAVHAVRRAAIPPEATAVVVGTGMVGLLVVQVLFASGCRRVIGVDTDPRRLDLAVQVGADAVRGDPDTVAAAVRERTGGAGADLAIEVVGVPGAVLTAIGSVRKGGQVVLVGNLSPLVDLPLQVVVSRQLTIFGSCASAGEYPECIDLLSSRKVGVDMLMSAVAPLSEGAGWFERLTSGAGDLMKVVLQPDLNGAR